MLKKKYLFLIILVCLFAVSAVSAEEMSNETNMLANDYDSSLTTESVDENILTDSYETFQELQDEKENVEKSGFINLTAPELTKYYRGPERFVVTLTDDDNPLPNQQIHIVIKGATYTRTTDSSGQASIAINLNYGEYDVIVNYEDINVTSKITVLSTINGNDVVKMYKNDTQYYATFLDSEGNYLSKDTAVTLNLNGIFYERKIIDNKGTAKLDINEQPGEYILTAINPVTGEHAVNTIIVLSNIVENHDLIKYYNESDRFSVRILDSAGNPASGAKVKFTIQDNVYEATSNSNGYAFLDAVLQPETYGVTTSYGGFEVWNIIVILPTLTDNDMKVSSSDIYEGENEVIKVVLPKDATGKVSTTVNGKEYSANVNNGAANIIVSGLNHGNYETEVIYYGDSHYNSVKNKTSFIVDKTVDLSAPDVTKYYGGSERFIVTLKDLNGNPIKNAVVKITINGRTSDKTTDDNGIASMGINLNSGEYITTTEYDGIKVNSTVTVKDTVIAKDFTKIFKNGTQYQGTFVDSKGNLIKNTDVKININGVFYTRTTGSNGVAQMNINLPPGTYILTATNPLSGEQHTTKVTVLPNIVENHDLTKYYKNASQYSLRLLDDKGNPVGAGVSIQLNINGVFYTKTSDANGYVKMNINLPPGTYIITAEYKGLRASNTIKVLSVLETKDLNMKFRDGSKFEAKVLDGQGNPYAGQTVTFNINGVFYTKTTDADGIVRLNINLPAGTYIITSMYNGLNAANNVKIAPDYLYYTIGSNPLDYDYYMNEYNRFSLDWKYSPQWGGMVRTIYDIYGNQGLEVRDQDVHAGVKYNCYEASTGKEISLNSAGEIIIWSYGKGYTEEYIRYDYDNNIIERGKWVYQ